MQRQALPVRKIILIALVLVGIGFSIYLAWAYNTDIASALRRADLRVVAGCLLLLTLANVSIALVFSELASTEADLPVPKVAVAGAFLLAQMGKYMPGRVWGLVMQKMALGDTLKARAMLVANLEITLISLVGMTGSGLACIALVPLGGVAAFAIVLLTVGAMLVTMSFRFTKRIVDVAVRVVGKEGSMLERDETGDSTAHLARTAPFILAYLSLYVLGWAILLWSGLGTGLDVALRFVAVQSASQILGALSMVPAGIGVREVGLIASSVWFGTNANAIIALVVITRLVMVCIDLLSIPIGVVMLYGGRGK